MIECQRCKSGYLLDPDNDLFCGFCGASVIGISINLIDPEGPIYLDQGETIRVCLSLENNGLTAASLQEEPSVRVSLLT